MGRLSGKETLVLEGETVPGEGHPAPGPLLAGVHPARGSPSCRPAMRVSDLLHQPPQWRWPLSCNRSPYVPLWLSPSIGANSMEIY